MTEDFHPPGPIEGYALIGDRETAALVDRTGSIDWLCVPRFDSPACFARLLGDERHGFWRIRPAVAVEEVRRRYRPATLVLETEFVTAAGTVRVIDWMPVRKGPMALNRLVEGVEGEVPMVMNLTLRFTYGSTEPWVRHTTSGIVATAGPDTVYVRGDVDMRGENMHTMAEFTLRPGERRCVNMAWTRTHDPVPDLLNVPHSLVETETYWRAWSQRFESESPWREHVLRSLITLEALIYRPTGGVVAAPTTSLPEQLGGERNWDYRYCWLRDASFTFRALIRSGYLEEAAGWREWLMNAVAGNPAKASILYGLAGERFLPEVTIDWLPGYQGARPVRVGNAASEQHQLDIYGEVMDAMHLARRAGMDADENAWRVQRKLVEHIEEAWKLPDEGIWEVRAPARHFVHSKVMAWVAADRAVAAVTEHGLPGDAERWRALRREIHAEVCERGFDTRLDSFVQHYDGRDPDASLLVMAEVGFLPPDDPRFVGTVERIRERLMEDGLVYRYPLDSAVDGLPAGEGAFLLCTFWMASALARMGRRAEAIETFERVLALENDVGLLGEQYDLAAGRMVGNFPQAFSHTGIINTAAVLDDTVATDRE